MDGELHIDYAALKAFADETRAAAGWVVAQCSLAVSSAIAAASRSVELPHQAATVFGSQWDSDIEAFGISIANLLDGLRIVAEDPYVRTDNAVAGGQ